MNKPSISEDEKVLIEKLHNGQSEYWKIIRELQSKSSDPIATVDNLGWKNPVTWDFILILNPDEQQSLFSYMLDTATDRNHPCRERAIESIYRLPRQWVLKNIEAKMQPLIELYEDEANNCILELFGRLDFNKAIEWAKKAYQHENEDIREIGQDWLEFHNLLDTD